ncbi:hypothetical protein [Micromonospora sp. DT47]|uniref:hypothetical protein n=1 Tax=Micromonospora sp. DT47 TaxID=3393431 RepID=UPI003CE7774C
MADDRFAAVADLWETHLQAPFPSRLRGTEVAGVDMVMLDADVAGCVSSWLQNRGSLDARRRRVLASCQEQLIRVIPVLADQEAAYYRRLHDMAALVSAEPDASGIDLQSSV